MALTETLTKGLTETLSEALIGTLTLAIALDQGKSMAGPGLLNFGPDSRHSLG